MDFWWFQGDLTVFVCPSVRSFATQDLRIDSLFFFDFLHEVSHKVRKVTKTNFSKKSYWDPKNHKNDPKMRFWGVLTKIGSIHMYFFYLDMKVLLLFQLSAKFVCLGKNCFLNYGPKTFRPKGYWVIPKVISQTVIELHLKNKVCFLHVSRDP